MATTARAAMGQDETSSQELGNSSGSPTWVAAPSPAAFHRPLLGTGLQVDQPAHELILKWDVNSAGGSLICCATMLLPILAFTVG